jgi:hypothetical protein
MHVARRICHVASAIKVCYVDALASLARATPTGSAGCGDYPERGLVVLLEPGGEALQVGDVLTCGALADLRVLGQKRQESGYRIIRRKRGASPARDRVYEKGGGPASVPDSSLNGSFLERGSRTPFSYVASMSPT